MLRFIRAHARPLSVVLMALAVAVGSAACAPPEPAPPPPPPPVESPPPALNPGGFACPVTGTTYTDSYGPRPNGTFHYGIDMMGPIGRSEYAVKNGTVSYAVESAGGNAAYLFASDGNVYYYAHMSQFVGANRAVVQGDVIGLLGQTGNATGPHLHFEIRIGGANGTRIDPYATLRAAAC
jgi:murein DD-endopeptidase MepM/ murein hydrolase activator NlpD